MLKTKPQVKEKENAEPFEYKEGTLEIKNLSFRHYTSPDEQKIKDKDGKEI